MPYRYAIAGGFDFEVPCCEPQLVYEASGGAFRSYECVIVILTWEKKLLNLPLITQGDGYTTHSSGMFGRVGLSKHTKLCFVFNFATPLLLALRRFLQNVPGSWPL
jgi:hypothetical protein